MQSSYCKEEVIEVEESTGVIVTRQPVQPIATVGPKAVNPTLSEPEQTNIGLIIGGILAGCCLVIVASIWVSRLLIAEEKEEDNFDDVMPESP